MIPFNRPPCTGNEAQYVTAAMRSDKLSGDGAFSRRCQAWFESRLGCDKALLTPSCTHALEMAAILTDVGPGDEIIMPSYTFVSTANAFVIRGARIVFVDIRPDTMNMDVRLIERAITPRTKAIVPVHYAGVACDMPAIMSIAERYQLYVIEDAAQGMMASINDRPLGSIGHLSAFSFHETKNYTSGGEGGLLVINDPKFTNRAEIIREKGTNRSQFFRGMADKYTWMDIGSSFLPSELQAAYLWGQLECAEAINEQRLEIWRRYKQALRPLADSGKLALPVIPEGCTHNGHMFYLKMSDINERSALIEHLKIRNVMAVFHYVPLHSSPAGKKFGYMSGRDVYTTIESERLVRLPIWYGMGESETDRVIRAITTFSAEPPRQ